MVQLESHCQQKEERHRPIHPPIHPSVLVEKVDRTRTPAFSLRAMLPKGHRGPPWSRPRSCPSHPRLDPKQGGAGAPNRALHDFKACELKSFVRKVHRSPGILEDLVRKKRDATWGEEKPTATGTRGFSRKLGTLIHRSFDS